MSIDSFVYVCCFLKRPLHFFHDFLTKFIFIIIICWNMHFLFNLLNFEGFLLRSFTKFSFYLWSFYEICLLFMIFLRNLCFIHDLFIKCVFYSWLFDKIFILFAIPWLKLHFICYLWTEFTIYSDFLMKFSFYLWSLWNFIFTILTKFSFYSWYYDEICILFSIYWWNYKVFFFKLMKLIFYFLATISGNLPYFSSKMFYMLISRLIIVFSWFLENSALNFWNSTIPQFVNQ